MTAIETTAVDSRTPPGFDGGPDEGPRDLKERITRLLAGYTTAQKAGAAGVAVAVVVGLLLVSRLTGGPEYAPLYTELTAEDGGAIVAELEKQGIPHRISQGGTSILVPADKVHETRMKLSSTELPGDTKVGYGVLDNQGLTTSEFGQRVGFQRAMEGELARTIESLDAVDTAVVHLALPAEQVFARDDEKPSASVLVRTKGSEQLSEDQVRAIVNLVASGIEGIKVRLTAKGATRDEVDAALDAEEAVLREGLGPLVFGVDDDTMESVVLDLLRGRNWTLGLAESVTGGLVAARIVDVPGASEVFRGSIVSYATEVKQRILGVSEGPVVSEEAALEMAHGARRVLDTDVGLALTGVDGPAEQDGKPAGTLCIGLVWPDGELTRDLRVYGLREQMRQMSVISALDLLRRTLVA
mgnify:CR=1 FL=1